MKQQERINEAMRSLDNMRRAAMPEGLHERLLRALPPARPHAIGLRRPAAWLMAAGIALLASLNIYTLLARREQRADTTALYSNPVAAEYFAPPPSI